MLPIHGMVVAVPCDGTAMVIVGNGRREVVKREFSYVVEGDRLILTIVQPNVVRAYVLATTT